MDKQTYQREYMRGWLADPVNREKQRASGRATKRKAYANSTQRAEFLRRQQTAREACRNAGICWRCKSAAVPSKALCARCFLMSAAKAHLGARKRWIELAELVERHGYKCPYTGRLLRPGYNLSFDHVVAVSKGGARSIDNLVPCDLDANNAKRTMSVAEFVQLCRDVTTQMGN